MDRCFTFKSSLKGLIEVEDTLEAYIRFGEKVACFYATNAYCADVPPLIEISCEKVTVRIEDLDVSYRYPDGTITKPDVERPVPIGKVTGEAVIQHVLVIFIRHWKIIPTLRWSFQC